MTTNLSELQAMIRGTVAATSPSERKNALKSIQWRLRGPHGEFVGLNNSLACVFVPEAQAEIFDGRDNELMKLRIYEFALGPLAIEILKPL